MQFFRYKVLSVVQLHVMYRTTYLVVIYVITVVQNRMNMCD